MTNEDIRTRLINMIDPDQPPTQKQFDCIVRAVEFGKLDLDNPPFEYLTKSSAMNYIKAGVEGAAQPVPVVVPEEPSALERLMSMDFGKNIRSKSEVIASIRAALDELEAL